MTENYMCLLEIFGKGFQVKLGGKMDRCTKKVENHVLEGALFATVAVKLGIFFVV